MGGLIKLTVVCIVLFFAPSAEAWGGFHGWQVPTRRNPSNEQVLGQISVELVELKNLVNSLDTSVNPVRSIGDGGDQFDSPIIHFAADEDSADELDRSNATDSSNDTVVQTTPEAPAATNGPSITTRAPPSPSPSCQQTVRHFVIEANAIIAQIQDHIDRNRPVSILPIERGNGRGGGGLGGRGSPRRGGVGGAGEVSGFNPGRNGDFADYWFLPPPFFGGRGGWGGNNNNADYDNTDESPDDPFRHLRNRGKYY